MTFIYLETNDVEIKIMIIVVINYVSGFYNYCLFNIIIHKVFY